MGINRIVISVYDSLPSVFTTIGILGTFLGIYFGLKKIYRFKLNHLWLVIRKI